MSFWPWISRHWRQADARLAQSARRSARMVERVRRLKEGQQIFEYRPSPRSPSKRCGVQTTGPPLLSDSTRPPPHQPPQTARHPAAKSHRPRHRKRSPRQFTHRFTNLPPPPTSPSAVNHSHRTAESPGCWTLIILALLLVLWPELIGWLYSVWCVVLALRAVWHFSRALDRQRQHP